MAETPFVQHATAVLWPSFLVAGLATILFFVAFDPQDLAALLGNTEAGRLGVYTIGIFLFWLLTMTSCLLTCYFQRTCEIKNV